MEYIKVYVNDKKNSKKRVAVNAELIEDRPHSVRVRLSDGNVIVRKKNRDIVK